MSTLTAPLPPPSSRTPRPVHSGAAELRSVVVGPLSKNTAASHAGTDTGVRHFVELRENALLVLKAGALPPTLRCVSGSIWITQEGDARDCLLHPGNIWFSGIHGKVVVTALSAARIEMIP